MSFGDAASLKARIDRFVADADLRERITRDQRESIAGRLTYGATMRRIAHRIGSLLSESAQALPKISKSVEIGQAA